MLPLLYTVREASGRIGLSERTLRKAISKGRLRVFRPTGLRRAVRVPEDALLEFLGLEATTAGAGPADPAEMAGSRPCARPGSE